MSDESWAALTDGQLHAELAAHLDHLTAMSARNIGFPAATDIDVVALTPFLGFMLNNLNDPTECGRYPMHTKRFETEACAMIADLVGLPPDDRWGYVTSGATEGNEHGLYLARERFPASVVYVSAAAHPTIGTIVDRLGMGHVVVDATPSGEMDYDNLADNLAPRREFAAIVVACIGTPLAEAVDDVSRINRVLDDVGIQRRWIHADAALSGIPLAVLDDQRRPPFGFPAGTTSMVLSGHKFVGVPIPCGLFAMRDSDRPGSLRVATYTGSPANTWANSRSGFAALCLWYTLRRHGIDGLRTRADQSRDLASYTHRRLVEIGWPAWRHNPLGFTVVLQTPPPELTARWPLPNHGQVSHIICMPGLGTDRVDAFIDDLRLATQPAGSDPLSSGQPSTGRVNGAAVNPRRPLGLPQPRSSSRRSHQPT